MGEFRPHHAVWQPMQFRQLPQSKLEIGPLCEPQQPLRPTPFRCDPADDLLELGGCSPC